MVCFFFKFMAFMIFIYQLYVANKVPACSLVWAAFKMPQDSSYVRIPTAEGSGGSRGFQVIFCYFLGASDGQCGKLDGPLGYKAYVN